MDKCHTSMLDDFSSMFSVLMFKFFLQNVSVTTV